LSFGLATSAGLWLHPDGTGHLVYGFIPMGLAIWFMATSRWDWPFSLWLHPDGTGHLVYGFIPVGLAIWFMATSRWDWPFGLWLHPNGTGHLVYGYIPMGLAIWFMASTFITIIYYFGLEFLMMNKIKLNAYERVIACDTETPITLYAKYVGSDIGFLLESKEQPKGRYSFMSTNPDLVIKAYGDQIEVMEKGQKTVMTGKVLDVIKERIERYEVDNDTVLPFVGGAVGTVGYDMIKQYEVIPQINTDDVKVPDAHLMFVTETLVFDHFHDQLHIVVLEEETSYGAAKADSRIKAIEAKLMNPMVLKVAKVTEPLTFESNVTQEVFEASVRKAKEYIYEGDIFQVVLSQRWKADCKTDPFMLYRKLRRVNPSPYMFYFNFESYEIVGASPEMLVEMRHGHIKNCPIAGTRKRGKTAKEDEALGADLLGDLKERAEHNMLVDLGRNDMGKIAKIGSVEVTKYMEVQHYSHVMHLVSLVEGERGADKDMFEVLMSFLPAGTLSGAPKIRAMEIIEELETTKRGIYGGAIGYFGFNNNVDMCIAIRTMVVKDETVYIQAGAGIVADSDPSKEYEESENKAMALIAAING